MIDRREVLRTGLLSIAVSSLVFAVVPAGAQDKYPDHPVRVVVPFPPGGVTDSIGRLWAESIKPHLGTIVIDNRGGAGGTIGAADVVRSAPDGYSVLIGNTSNIVFNPIIMAKPPYDPVKDLMPVAIITEVPTSIVVHPSVPAKNLKELIAYAKANPGKLSYGSAGAGTTTNLSGELLKELGGDLKIVHIPYKGAGPGIRDLVGGQIPMFTPNVTASLIELHKAGKVRILSINAPKRIKAAPDIPTSTEAGLPGMNVLVFNGLFVPAGTPKAIIDRIAAANQKAMSDPKLQEALVKAGAEPVVDSGPKEAAQFVDDEIKRWGPILKASGMTK